MTTITARVRRGSAYQYSWWQIFAVWLAAGAPMWVLGWVAYPAMSAGLPAADAGLLRVKLLTAGLVWEFVLSLTIVYRERGDIRLATVSRRFWLNHPVSPRTGETNKRLWWWVVPLILLVAVLEMALSPVVSDVWVSALPFLAEPEGYDASAMFATPEVRAQWVGAWGLLGWFLLLSVFNTFLGEEFVFRGALLPKMAGVFGAWDWVANGVIFGFYHLHQPWGIPGAVVLGLVAAFAGKRWRCNWFPIILHSGQSVFFLFLILGVVLGLA